MRTQVILRGADGAYVGRTEHAADSGPWDTSTADAATNQILASVSAEFGRYAHGVIVGAFYSVRLSCGGVVHIFERGPQRLKLGQAVRVEHAFTARILE